MTALTQDAVERVLEEYKNRSQAVKEQVFDLVLNSSGNVSLDDAYNMDIQDFTLMKKQLAEIIQVKTKNHIKSLKIQ